MSDPRNEKGSALDRAAVQLEEPAVPRQPMPSGIDITDRAGAQRLEAFDDNEFGGEG